MINQMKKYKGQRKKKTFDKSTMKINQNKLLRSWAFVDHNFTTIPLKMTWSVCDFYFVLDMCIVNR